MIPERAAVAVDSTVQGEDVAMSIDQSALAHIMNVLTDLYADPELAVIREYSTNGLDSHIEAGQSRPIEITTPTDLRPLLTIRDYGVGLDLDDIKDIYSRYGASTKRSSNDAVGMLGLGCKSALAFVDQFTLAGIKGGKRIMVSISRDETGAGTMKVLPDSGDTDEPDGVEVCIPASAYTDLEDKARDFFSYWEPGLALLNGEPVAALEGYAVGDYLVAERTRNAWDSTGRHDNRPLTVIMGNVSYPPPDGYTHPAVDSLPKDKRLVVRVPIGAVHFTPAREGLQDSERTRKSLDSALEGFRREVETAVTAAVTEAPDRPTAARGLIEARAAFGKANLPELEWEGEEIPTVLSAEDLADVPGSKPGDTKAAALWIAKVVSGYNGGRSARGPAGQISLDDAGKNPWILGYRNTKWTATQRDKAERYLTHHGLHDDPHHAAIYLTDAEEVPRPEWIDGAVTAVHWQDIREWKDPLGRSEGGTGGTKYAGTYPVYCDWRQHEKFDAEELAEKNQRKVFYVEDEKWGWYSRATNAIIGGEDTYLVCLAASRAAKFKRTFPDVRNGLPIAKEAIAGKLASLTDLERQALAVEDRIYHHRGPLAAVPHERIADPELSRAVKIIRVINEGKLRAHTEAWFPLVSRPPLDADDKIDIEMILQKYPLLSSIPEWQALDKVDHIVLYVNAAYAAIKNQED